MIFHDLMIDNLIISKYLSAEMVGIYGLAGTFLLFMDMLDPSTTLKSIINTVLIKKYTSNNSFEFIKKSHSFYNKFSLFFLIPVVAGLMLLSENIVVHIFKSDYILSAKLLYFIAPFFLFQPLIRGLSMVINLLEKNYIMLFSVISSVYNLLMDIILVRYWGLKGIAVATGSALMLMYLIHFILIRRYIKIDFPIKIILKIIANIIPMVLFLVLSRNVINGTLALFMVVLCGGAIYFGTSTINKVFSQEERDIINDLAKINIWKF